MNKLLNERGEEIPPRPTWASHKEVIVAAALNSLDERDAKNILERKAAAIDALVAFKLEPMDEYKVGKHFEALGWCVDSQFLDEIENVIVGIIIERRRIEREWGNAQNPAPPIEIGDEVIVGAERGRVAGIYRHRPAYIEVVTESTGPNSRLLVKYENIVKA